MNKTKNLIMRKLVSTLFGLSLFACTAVMADESESEAFSMPVQDAFKITGRGTVITGQVASGSISVGDVVCVPLASGETAAREVGGIEMFRKMLDRAEAGQRAGILVADVDSKMVSKGESLHTDCELEPQEDENPE